MPFDQADRLKGFATLVIVRAEDCAGRPLSTDECVDALLDSSPELDEDVARLLARSYRRAVRNGEW